MDIDKIINTKIQVVMKQMMQTIVQKLIKYVDQEVAAKMIEQHEELKSQMDNTFRVLFIKQERADTKIKLIEEI